MAARLAISMALLTQPVLGWMNIARCVRGEFIQQDIHGSNGTVAGYATSLQTMVPMYGDLVSISEGGDEVNCSSAAHGINGNHILAADTPAAYRMTDVTKDKGEASKNQYYLYIFKSKHFDKYAYMATCIPGGIVGTNVLNISNGVIAAYTIVLQALMPTYGDLWYLGQSRTAADCLAPQDAINAGNTSTINALKKKKEYPAVKEVGMFSAGGKGDPNKTYLYVFQNRDWNNTWGMFAEPAISPVQEEYWAQTTTKPSRRRRRRKGRRLNEEVEEVLV